MYYWSNNTENGTTLEEEILKMKNVSSVYIASAFISTEGVKLIKKIAEKYKLSMKKIKLYISEEFSSIKPHLILESLIKICTVSIVFDKSFHPKVYLLNNNESSKVIFGSSNLTKGGFSNNIEFDYIGQIKKDERQKINQFFELCKDISTLVDDEIITYYKKHSKELEALRKSQKKLRRVMKGFAHQYDTFDEDEYTIENYYFDYTDYETFFTRNQKLDSHTIRKQRKVVQDKILVIHKMIYPDIKKMGIECHWRDENITSLIRPCVYNKGKVGWNGVRYGKTKEEVYALNFNLEKDEFLGFQKHGCLQYCIIPSGFEINLYLAVKHEAIDRGYLVENFSKLRLQIENELANLIGYKMQWVIYNELINKESVFDIDSSDPKDFYNYYTKNDDDGKESFLRLVYSPDDFVLKTKESISNEILSKLNLLLPLYNTIVFRPRLVSN